MLFGVYFTFFISSPGVLHRIVQHGRPDPRGEDLNRKGHEREWTTYNSVSVEYCKVLVCPMCKLGNDGVHV